MLATETQEIADYLRQVMIDKYGKDSVKEHIADTRDTLCYATNDNQSATIGLMEREADLAIVVGGYNSSNTTHLVELLEQKFKTFFIRSAEEIKSVHEIEHFDIHVKKVIFENTFLPSSEVPMKIVITSGASCPDSIVDRVIQRILDLLNVNTTIEEVLKIEK
jgi:4-hydroxy-3-methylbut-2-enyl diphosphate reductase